MHIVIFGTGSVAHSITPFLFAEFEDCCITYISNNKKEFRQNIRFWYSNQTIQFQFCDVSTESPSIPEKIDLIINASIPSLNVPILKYCIEKDATYYDLISDFSEDYLPTQILFADVLKENSIAAVANCGISPGIINLEVAEVCRGGDKKVNVYVYDHLEGKKAVYTWSPYIIEKEKRKKPLGIVDGKVVEAEHTFHTHVFDTIGINSLAYYNDESITLPRYTNIHEFHYYVAGTEVEFSNKSVNSYNAKKIYNYCKKGLISSGHMQYDLETEHRSVRYTSTDILTIQSYVKGASHVSYSTALALICFIKNTSACLEPGLYFPEQLPVETQKNILTSFKEYTL